MDGADLLCKEVDLEIESQIKVLKARKEFLISKIRNELSIQITTIPRELRRKTVREVIADYTSKTKEEAPAKAVPAISKSDLRVQTREKAKKIFSQNISLQELLDLKRKEESRRRNKAKIRQRTNRGRRGRNAKAGDRRKPRNINKLRI